MDSQKAGSFRGILSEVLVRGMKRGSQNLDRFKGFDAEFVMLGQRAARSNSWALSGSFLTRVWGRLGAAHSET